MHHLLVYADSLSWGLIPGTRDRLEFGRRWPGVLENGLRALGQDVRVIEDCLNGRRTVWDDPFKAGRNGREMLSQRIEIHSPIALVILMLGTNDFQSMHQNNAFHSSQGIASLITTIRQAPIEPGMPLPNILVLSPPPIGTPKGVIAEKFLGGQERSKGLAEAFRAVAASLGCAFFAAGDVVASSPVDGVHLDASEHMTLGTKLVTVVLPLLPDPV